MCLHAVEELHVHVDVVLDVAGQAAVARGVGESGRLACKVEQDGDVVHPQAPGDVFDVAGSAELEPLLVEVVDPA